MEMRLNSLKQERFIPIYLLEKNVKCFGRSQSPDNKMPLLLRPPRKEHSKVEEYHSDVGLNQTLENSEQLKIPAKAERSFGGHLWSVAMLLVMLDISYYQ